MTIFIVISHCIYKPIIYIFIVELGPRRMSERDLPSRVLNEQQNINSRGPPPHHLSQIQSSKSVPSLHSKCFTKIYIMKLGLTNFINYLF